METGGSGFEVQPWLHKLKASLGHVIGSLKNLTRPPKPITFHLLTILMLTSASPKRLEQHQVVSLKKEKEKRAHL